MQKGLAFGFLAAGVIAAAIATSEALAAYQDNFGPSRIGFVNVECPSDTTSPCSVVVQRLRSPTAQAISDAIAAGLDTPQPSVEPPVKRIATRAQLGTFLTATSPAP
jgi:hypothetical protein